MDRWVRTSDAPQACNRSVRKRERWRATYAASRGDEGVRTSVGVRLGIRGSMDGLIQVCSSSFVAPIHRPVGEGIHVGALSSALHEQIFFIAPTLGPSHRRTICVCRRNGSGREASTTRPACPSSLARDRARIGISEFSPLCGRHSSACYGGSEGVPRDHEGIVSTARIHRAMTRRGIPGSGSASPPSNPGSDLPRSSAAHVRFRLRWGCGAASEALFRPRVASMPRGPPEGRF